MIVQVKAIWNLVLTRQIYSEETNGAHAHYREPVPLTHKVPHCFGSAHDNYMNTFLFNSFRVTLHDLIDTLSQINASCPLMNAPYTFLSLH